MKRFLFLVLTVVVACSLFVLSAFGAEYGDIIEVLNLDTYLTYETIPVGEYYLQIVDGDDVIFTSSVFDFVEGSHYLGSYYGSDVVLQLTQNSTLAERYGDGLSSTLSLGDYAFGDEVTFSFVRFNPTGAAPSSPDFFADIGTFFTSAISWLGNVASFIVTRPVFLVVLAMPIVGFSVGLFSRIKNL